MNVCLSLSSCHFPALYVIWFSREREREILYPELIFDGDEGVIPACGGRDCSIKWLIKRDHATSNIYLFRFKSHSVEYLLPFLVLNGGLCPSFQFPISN